MLSPALLAREAGRGWASDVHIAPKTAMLYKCFTIPLARSNIQNSFFFRTPTVAAPLFHGLSTPATMSRSADRYALDTKESHLGCAPVGGGPLHEAGHATAA